MEVVTEEARRRLKGGSEEAQKRLKNYQNNERP